MKIRIDNDFVFNWAIERGGLPEDLSSVLEKHLHLSVFDKRIELVEGIDYDITGNVIRIEVTPAIANILGTYKAEFHYILPDIGLIDEDRRCAVDVDAFQIVAKTAQADDSSEFSMTSDMAIAFKGDKGDTGIGVPIGGTTGQQLVKKSNVDYDLEWQSTVGTGDMLKSEYDKNGNGIVDNAEKVNGFTVETNVPANAKFTDTIYTHPTSHPYSMITGAPASLPANGGDSATVNGKTVEENVPAGAKFTDTTYSEITEAEINTGTASTLRAVTARRVTFILSKASTLISNAISALTKNDVGLGNLDNIQQATKEEFNTHDADGTRHITAGERSAWGAKWDYNESTIKGVKVNNATNADTVNGKTVAVNVPSGAKFTDTVYSHPTSDGNLHVPATGTTNNGKVLKAGATAGSLVWGTDNDTITTINGKTGVITKADIVALGIPAQDTVYTHPAGTNPHGTTKADVGLGNVDNTSDLNKPVSTAQASAIDEKYTKPALGIPKTDLVTDVQTSLGKADTALQSFTETDPTVPSWAKAASKPSYSYTEITGTKPPTDAQKNSDITKAEIEAKLTGSITSHTHVETDPTVPSWAKQTNKPSYTATEVGAIPASQKGANNGVAELDSTGKVLSSQLPSYVDDVLEYATSTNFPATGETGKIYIAINTNLTYRWTGTAYTEISPSIALGETSSTAYRGDRGKIAYDHSQATHAPANAQKNSDITKAEIEAKLTGTITTHSHTVTKANVGLGNVDNTSDANKPVSTAQQTALDGKLDTSSFAGSTFTANVIPLDNPLGSFRVATASNVATYTLSTTKVIGAWAKILVNAATEPAVTGGTLIKGSDFEASTNMYLYVMYDGTKTEYYFAEI